MKTECMDCGKIISNPFVDTDNKGRLYFFCNKEHRDNYERFLIERAIICNPIGSMVCFWAFCYGFIKCLFQKKKPTIR